MVCKKCGKSFNDNIITCPFCGVGQENQINIKKLENELEKLKIEDNPSSFYNGKNDGFEIFDIDDIIEDLEELKIKDEKKDDVLVPRVEPVSDQEIIDLIDDIKENKELFIRDKSQYKYTQKKNVENNQNKNMTINELYNKQKLYNSDDIKTEVQKEVILPKSISETPIFNIEYEGHEKKYKKEIIICIIVLMFILMGGGLFIYKLKFSPKVIIMNHLNAICNKIQNTIDNHIDNISNILDGDKISVNSVFNITTTKDKIANKEVINIKYSEDKECKTQFFEFTNLNKIKTEFQRMFIRNNKLYFSDKNLNDEYYVTDAKFYSILNNNSTYLFNQFLDIIKNNITNNDFKTKNIKEIFEEKEYKLKEYTLNISEKQYSTIYSDFLNKIKEDKNSVNIILKKYHYSSAELMNEIDKKINKLKSGDTNKNILSIKFYIDSNKEIIKYVINYNKYDITLWNIDNKLNLIINKDDNELLTVQIKKIDNKTNEHQISLNYDNYKLHGSYHEEDSKVIFNYQKNYNTSEIIEIVNLVLTKGQKEDNKYSNTISIAYQNSDNVNVLSKNINITNVIGANKSEYIPTPTKTIIIDNNMRNELKQKFSMFIK